MHQRWAPPPLALTGFLGEGHALGTHRDAMHKAQPLHTSALFITLEGSRTPFSLVKFRGWECFPALLLLQWPAALRKMLSKALDIS